MEVKDKRRSETWKRSIPPRKDFVAKLRRLADALESGEAFSIQIAGERVYIPKDAIISIER